jgi:hypothetical protein
MTTDKFATNAPFVIFGTACLAFAGWLIYDGVKATTANRSERSHRLSGNNPEPTGAMVRPSIPPPGGPHDELLDQLRVGMFRVEAEKSLAPLTPFVVEPVDMTSGLPVLRSRYRVYLERCHPELMPDINPQEFQPAYFRLILEFKGDLMNHPLQDIKLTLSRKQGP